ncbi:hypothetical protein C8R44DRAFT_946921, partial [Mycena epipterygia]
FSQSRAAHPRLGRFGLSTASSTHPRPSPRSSRGRPFPKRPRIHTLNSERLQPSDHMDISFRPRLRIFVSVPPAETPVIMQYCKHKGVSIVYPPRTAGFFYYHRPKELPFIAGAIRFRVAAVNPAAFSAGRDLVRPDGAPWEISLPTILKRQPILRQRLLRDNLVTEAELDECAILFPSNHFRAPSIIHRFDQLFPVKFDSAHSVQVICGGQKYRCNDALVFTSALGRALVRFELSKLPEHAKSRVAVLRIVKMIEPPKLRIPDYDGHVPLPIEGQLVLRPRRSKGVCEKPWSRKLDSAVGKPLAVLLDAEEATG